ncbi:DUF5134 domain-containing protein [Streptomyces sp. J2-1]|uniref:DUF5134 domain-containing protein n=1 Tax=Streptomyces corallincola TaxID=2851888 RepID=UPI001C38BC63|nr:DUF5134 domain-containing protein [Streptomyces corallincola]MBV2356700.1 DUF5134 domain-containing protein [Streptomyces corallincola]
MIDATGLRLILTALFVLPALYALWLVAAPGRPLNSRVTHGFHAVMGMAMAAMSWPGGSGLLVGPQILVFSAGAVWFVIAALTRPDGMTRPAALLRAVPHIVMMAGMVWMVAVMDGSAMASGAGGPGHDMPGMDMSGAGALSAMTLSGTGDRWIAGLLAFFLVGVGLRWLAQAFDQARLATPVAAQGTAAVAGIRPGAREPACHAAMAVGMGVMFLLLV